MRGGWMRTIVLLLVLAATPGRAAEPDPDVHAAAGIAGVARTGRATPVRVTIATGSAPLDGVIVAQWGSSTVQRTVSIPAQTRRDLELYVTSAESPDQILVSLVRAGVQRPAMTAPIQVRAAGADFSLCVVPPIGVTDDAGCAATATPDQLPRDPRGYDAVDRVIWHAGPRSALSPEQQLALTAWSDRAKDRTAMRGDAPSISPPAPPPAGFAEGFAPIVFGLAGYTGLIGTIALLLGGTRGRHPRLAYALVLVVAGGATALATGHVGPRRPIRIDHRTTIHQEPAATTVTMRASILFPSDDVYAVEAMIAEGTLVEASRPETTAYSVADHPMLAGHFALGASRRFTIDGVVPNRWLQLSRRGSLLRITNVSTAYLRDCGVASAEGQGRAIAPAESVDVAIAAGVEGEFATCRLVSPAFDFTEPRYPVAVAGESLLTVAVPAGDQP